MCSVSLSGTWCISSLITTNCAVLGVALTNVQDEYNILQGTVNGFATAVGFTISITLMAGIREKIQYNDIPEAFKDSLLYFLQQV